MRLYHVSYANLGEKVHLKPRVPALRGPEEPARPARICVAPRVGDCLRLFPQRDGKTQMWVYETEVKRLPKVSYVLPRKYVQDWRKYGREEVWLLSNEGHEFRRIGFARFYPMELMVGRLFWTWRRGGETYVRDLDNSDPTLINQLSAPGYAQVYGKLIWELRKSSREEKLRRRAG